MTTTRRCTLVHPFTLRPDVKWDEEDETFSEVTDGFPKSTALHDELRRFQYGSVLGLIIPTEIMILDLASPLVYAHVGWTWWIIMMLILGVIFLILTPIHIYAHVRKSSGGKKWYRMRMLVDALIFFNILLLSNSDQFAARYHDCPVTDQLTQRELLGRTLAEHGKTPERVALYCQQIIQPVMVSTLPLALSVNLSPVVILVFLVLNIVMQIINRPLAAAANQYDPVESTPHLVSKFLVVLFVSVLGMVVYWFKVKVTRLQFRQAALLTKEVQLSRAEEENVDLLLCATVPASALVRLADNEQCSDFAASATVLFSDMVSFTAWSSSRPPVEVILMLNTLTEGIDEAAVRLQVEKIKTIGDAYWAVTGLPEFSPDHAEVMCQFGEAMLRVIRTKARAHPEWGTVQFRVGIHSGPLNGGILGTAVISYEVFGETSDVAGALEQHGVPGRVVLSGETASAAQLEQEHLVQHISLTRNGRTYSTFILNRNVAEDPEDQVQVLRRVRGGLAWGVEPRGPSAVVSADSLTGLVSEQAGRDRRKAFFDRGPRRKRRG